MKALPEFELAAVGPVPERGLLPLLEDGWARGRARGAIAYDPARGEALPVPPFTFYLLPGRETRPRAVPPPEGEAGVGRPHQPCPFDSPDLLAERGVFTVARGSRRYHLIFNKYPVLRLHYLAVRPASDPPELLSQRLSGAEEIEDMCRLAAMLGHPHRLYFNSNRGRDGSRSGSSVNHWHFQVFPWAGGVLETPPRFAAGEGAVETGELPGWPARHRLYRSGDGAALAAALWRDLERVSVLDIAYNLELSPRPEGELTAVLFPRAPVEPLRFPDGGVLSGDFGGFELTGGVVVPSRPAFEWIRAHPEDAARLLRERLRASTTWPAA